MQPNSSHFDTFQFSREEISDMFLHPSNKWSSFLQFDTSQFLREVISDKFSQKLNIPPKKNKRGRQGYPSSSI